MTAPPVQPDPGDLDIRTVSGSGACTVTISGDVDAGTAPRFGRHLLEVLARPGVHTVELDLSGVTFLDSAGLTALVVAHRTAQGAGQAFCVRCGTGRAVRRPLEITGLSSVLTIVDA